MIKRIKKLLKANSIVVATSTTVVIIYLSLAYLNMKALGSFSYMDKLGHFFAYFVLTCTWFLVARKVSGLMFRVFIAIYVFLFGLLIEGLQLVLISYRQADLYDIVANLMGILFAFFLYDKMVELTREIS